MSATVNNPGTVSQGTSPNETATVIDALLATPLESWTVAQVQLAFNCVSTITNGGNPAATLGTVLGASNTAASTSGTKTVTQSQAPHLSATLLTSLLAVAPQNFTVAQLRTLKDAISRVVGGGNPAASAHKTESSLR